MKRDFDYHTDNGDLYEMSSIVQNTHTFGLDYINQLVMNVCVRHLQSSEPSYIELSVACDDVLLDTVRNISKALTKLSSELDLTNVSHLTAWRYDELKRQLHYLTELRDGLRHYFMHGYESELSPCSMITLPEIQELFDSAKEAKHSADLEWQFANPMPKVESL